MVAKSKETCNKSAKLRKLRYGSCAERHSPFVPPPQKKKCVRAVATDVRSGPREVLVMRELLLVSAAASRKKPSQFQGGKKARWKVGQVAGKPVKRPGCS
jgi:uncharacterized protein with von Willebrand factor type A (vWA) domain